MSTARVRLANGVLEPSERLGLDEGQKVMLTIGDRPLLHRPGSGMRSAAGAWKGTYDLEMLKRDIYAAGA